MAIETGDRAPEFDLEGPWPTRVRLSELLERGNVLLVFHPFAFTPVCSEEALDLQENLEEFRASETEVVLVACEPSATRLAWKEQLGLTYTVASDFWPHGAAARAYGVFDESNGAPVRGTFLIDRSGTVVWSLVQGMDDGRVGALAGSVDAIADDR